MRTVFFDIDTQLDFVFPAGALYVPGAEAILPAVARLNRYATAASLPLISSMDAHAEDDIEFRQWPHHCVKGAVGQRKAEATLVAGQIILEKQTVDVLASPRWKPLLDSLKAERYIVYGVATEVCVGIAARGLLEMGAQVILVEDATRALSLQSGSATLDELRAAGAHLSTVSRITGSSPV
ncbi:MAG: cysteine hydrolase [Bryobacteraceae bacterium]|nr:cysteine hydrolase [Bryobacteraceae bacterium]